MADHSMKVPLKKLLSLSWCLACWVGCDPAEKGSGPAGEAVTIRPVSPSRREAGPGPPPSPARAIPTYAADVAPLIDRYCLGCHEEGEARGGVVLEIPRGRSPGDGGRSLWLRVADALRSGVMPPEGEPRPGPAELETINAWLDVEVFPDERGPGRATLRRLNRAEYDNTVRDLIGLDLRPADEFPSDDVGYGFDNIGDVLSTSPILVERYLDAAERVVDAAFRSPEARRRIMAPPADSVPRAFRRFKPPVRSYPDKRVFVRRSAVAKDPELERQQRIYDILRAFADRAFRRPATHDELSRLLGVVLAAEKDGEDSESAVRLALRAVLASPHFLFHAESAREAVDGPGSPPPPDDDFALAARLSYFLWSSLPDEELSRLASGAALRHEETLRTQAGRMLRDRRSRSLAENFGGQWLQTRQLKDLAPDPALFPDFDEPLRGAMRRETELFFASVLEEDRSVLDFLDADYTFVNERLARHYGIAGVRGESFRRVSLAGTPRGGVLTQASVLTLTSNPTRTSPVRRGRWILETLLGTPPPPPPSGVEGLVEGSGAAAPATLRERMERHRAEPGCASCHRRMDPLGFGLENFDAVGAWRANEGGRPIDPSGRLPGGEPFDGPSGLRALLASRREAFSRCLAEKMLTYALGRGLRRSDRRAVDRIVAGLARDGSRFSALVLAVVESEPFRASDGKGEGP
jgi:Protein of unknown function (DUF1592)/Protein of unknown function (DUF1588)/Protein of unknown function (DUF1587)/Protein of unknown function (DUF1585)/Protein of unknown function (DUF1595)